MSRSAEGALNEHTPRGGEEVPVATCPGWMEQCEFCQKRFGDWSELDEETMDKIPSKPGFFEVALQNKGSTEVVDIALDHRDVQKAAASRLDLVRDRVADKKSKFTKSVILCRWMTFKHDSDKEVSTMCAHLINCGVVPRFMDSWTNLQNVLDSGSHYVYSDTLHKWCHPKKDAFWRKSKAPQSKSVEAVEGCDWSKPCTKCDSSFSKWKVLDQVVQNDLAPDQNGLYMVSVSYSGQREVVYVGYDYHNCKLNIRQNLKQQKGWLSHISKNKKFVNHSPTVHVRWIELKDLESENSLFLFAHLLNANSLPMLNDQLPGSNLLEHGKNFVQRAQDKKWCYETEHFRQAKNSKTKTRKQLLDELMDDYKDVQGESES